MKRTQKLVLLFTCTFFFCANTIYEDLERSIKDIPPEAIHKLESDSDLDVLLKDIGEARIVLLGEATHGTSEFYTWRARISRKLIEEKGFTIIAIEGDWTDTYYLNTYIKGESKQSSSAQSVLQEEFQQWPAWMWANEEFADFSEWLRIHNTGKAAHEQTNIYGLDLYGLWESMEAVRDYLEMLDTPTAEAALQALQCFAPYNKNEDAYAKATYNASDNCADELIKLLKTVESTIKSQSPANKDAFNAIQNSKVAINAERYFRTAALSSGLAWNIRDNHMSETIDKLLKHHEPGSKIIIWGHNSHIGDAKATNMADSDIISVGQLVKEKYGSERTYSVGYGTYSGTVIAAKSWGNNIQLMTIPKATPDSWEALLHKLGPPDKIIFMQPLQKQASLLQHIKHRAIGVVYNPLKETGNYIPSVIPERYNAFIFIDKTIGVTPIQ